MSYKFLGDFEYIPGESEVCMSTFWSLNFMCWEFYSTSFDVSSVWSGPPANNWNFGPAVPIIMAMLIFSDVSDNGSVIKQITDTGCNVVLTSMSNSPEFKCKQKQTVRCYLIVYCVLVNESDMNWSHGERGRWSTNDRTNVPCEKSTAIITTNVDPTSPMP